MNYEKGNSNNVLDYFTDPEIINYLSGIMSYDFEISDVNKCIEDVITTYRKEYLLQKRNSILSKIDKAEQENLTREEIEKESAKEEDIDKLEEAIGQIEDVLN